MAIFVLLCIRAAICAFFLALSRAFIRITDTDGRTQVEQVSQDINWELEDFAKWLLLAAKQLNLP